MCARDVNPQYADLHFFNKLNFFQHVLGTGLGHKLFEHLEANRNYYRIWVRNFETKKNVKKGLDEAVLRNQFE